MSQGPAIAFPVSPAVGVESWWSGSGAPSSGLGSAGDWYLDTAGTSPSNAAYATTLPSSPADGQVIYYQSAAMATAGIVWTFRYRAASASAYKWEFLGGFPLTATVLNADTQSSGGAWGDLATAGPLVVVPLAGDYLSHATCTMYASGGTAARGHFGTTTPGGTPTQWTGNDMAASAHYQSGAVQQLWTAVAASQELRMRYASVNTVQYTPRTLTVTPMRVG